MSHLTRESNMFLSDQLKQEDKKGTFIKLFDSYLLPQSLLKLLLS